MKALLPILSCLAITGLVEAQFSGSENFAGPAKDTVKWGPSFGQGSSLLTQTGGVLKFSNPVASTGDEDSFMAWPWQSFGPMDSSWSVQIDVNVPVLSFPNDEYAAAGVGVAVLNSANSADTFSMQVENFRDMGQPQEYHFLNSIDLDGNGLPEISTPAPTGKILSVRIVWNADTHILNAQYDADGPANGFSWRTLNTFNPIVDGWGMTPGDQFQIAVFGYADKTVVTSAKNFYADNFLIQPVSPTNLGGSDNFNDNDRDPGKWGTDFDDDDHHLTEINSRLEYTTASTGDGSAARPWITNTGSYDENWEVRTDVHVADFAATDGVLAAVLGVQTEAGAARIRLNLEKVADTATRTFQFVNDGPGNTGNESAAPGADASLRVAFDAANKTLRFYYDSDGRAGGYDWTELTSIDLADPDNDWALSSSSRFQVMVGCESQGLAVSSGEAFVDNFSAISDYDPPVTDSPNGFDQFPGVGRNLQKWGEEIGNGDADLLQLGDGSVRFISAQSAPDDENFRAWLWQANCSFSSSWSIQADVHVPEFPLPSGNTAAGMGIAVLNSGDADMGDTFSMAVENFNQTGLPQDYHFFANVDINGDGQTETFAPASSTLGSVRIAWDSAKKLLTAYYDADGPVNGYAWTVLKTFSPVGAANWGMTASNSFRIAIYGSAEGVEITQQHEFYADNFYVFGATTALPPVVKTQAVTGIDHQAAQVHGTVDAKNKPRAVYVDWGLTTSYGMTQPATPDIADGTSNTIIVSDLTGLMPHTKYNYRVRATSALGTGLGANMTFTTANRDPAAMADQVTVLPGATVILNLFGNDTDPDNDPLSLKSNTALVPSNAGKLSKSGASLVFTAAPNFAGATFTYIAKDAFGGSSAPATVTLVPGTCVLSTAQTFPIDALGGIYAVDVTATGWWSAVENSPWLSVNPVSGEDDGQVFVIVQPNTALASRTTTVTIGGQAHVVTQAGVVAPEISLADVPDPAVVGGLYSLWITPTSPVTYTATNLPPGLSLGKDGHISGRPTKAGDFDVKVKAKNAAGAAPDLTFTISVSPLSPGFIGTFHALVEASVEVNNGFGSRLELTVTKLGGVSGKLITASSSQSITGSLTPDPNDLDSATFDIVVGKGMDLRILNLTFQADANTMGGTVTVAPATSATVTGWRNPWTTALKASAFAALHTFSVEPPGGDPFLPDGFGFGSFTPAAATGALTVTIKLPDGTTATTGTFIGGNGEILVYAPLYSNRGCLSGMLTVAANDETDLSDNEISGTLSWFKFPALNSKDTVYPFGFPPTDLIAEGGAYLGIPKGEVVMGLANDPGNARLNFSGGELLQETAEFEIAFDLLNPSATGLTNKATFSTDPLENPNKVSMATINTATGAFSGEFTIAGDTPAQNRKVTFQGQIIRDPFMGLQVGRGFCLLPAPLVPPLTVTNALKFSSRVELGPN